MPLGLPPHLATRTTSTAVARAGHAAAAVCISAVGLVVLSIQQFLPQQILWPALLVLVPLIVLLVLLERSPSVFIAGSYLVIGSLCVAWYSLIASAQLGTPVANDNYSIVLLKLALILVIGVGPSLGASMVWVTAGYLMGEAASALALLWLSAPWVFDAVSFATWFIVMGLLAVLRLDRVAARDSQTEIYRAARDEMLADVRRAFEHRAAALLHDTVLNQLAMLAHSSGTLSPAARASIQNDLESIVGQEWFELGEATQGGDPSRGDHCRDATPNDRAARLRAIIKDAAADEVEVQVDGDTTGIEALDAEAFDELSRAIAQCIVNVRRHAHTESAEVILGGNASEASAMVIDGGRGFALDARTDGRLGVGTSIVGRLETIGGSAIVWSQPGKGTSVLLRVPVAPRGEGRA